MRSQAPAVAALLAAVAVVHCLPVILSGDNWGFWDWDMLEAAIEAARSSVVDHGQLPGWFPYMRGGEPLDANPLLPLGSPSFLVILMLGTIPGIKVWIVVRSFLALWGGYLLGRRLGLGLLGGIAVGVFFGLSSSYAQRVTHGHWNLQASVYLPLLIHAAMGAVEPRAWRARALGAVWLALMFLDGGPYTFTLGLLGLAPVAVWAALRGPLPSAAVAGAVIAALAIGLSAVKLLPVLDAYGGGARETPYGEGVALDFYDPDFKPSLGTFLFDALLDRDQTNRPGRYSPYHINVAAYVGMLGVGLVLLGGVLGGRAGRGALLIALPYLWLCLGASAPLNLWALLHELPGFSSMFVPAKFTPCYLLALAVAAGAGVDGLQRRLGSNGLGRLAAPVVVALLALDLSSVSWPVLAQSFPLEPVALERKAFHQLEASPYQRAYHFGVGFPYGDRPLTESHSLTADFPAVRANLGVLTGYFPTLPHPVSAHADAGPDAPGVEQLSDRPGADPVSLHWSPNRLDYEVDPDRDGLLVVNQNFHPHWTARGDGRPLVVGHYEGRLTVRLQPGVRQVTLSYASRHLRSGALISLVTAVLTAYLVIRGSDSRSGSAGETPSR